MGTRALSRARWLRLRAAGVLGLLCANVRAAGADAPHEDEKTRTIVLDAPTCETPSFSSAEFRRLLGIELTDDRLKIRAPASSDDRATPGDELIVRVPPETCRADASDVVVVLQAKKDDGVTQRVVIVSVADVTANARPRTLALAVAELIREIRQPTSDRSTTSTESSTPGAAPDAAPSPLVSAQPPPHPAGATDEPGIDDIALGATWRLFAAARASLLGARLSATLPLALAKVRLRGDLGGSWGSASDQLGSVQLSLTSGGLAALLAVTGKPSFVVGPRIELGYSHGNGTALRPLTKTDSDGRTFIGASFIAGVHAALLGPWSAVLEIEMGAGLRGQEMFADKRLVASTTGAFAGARVGIGYVYR